MAMCPRLQTRPIGIGRSTTTRSDECSDPGRTSPSLHAPSCLHAGRNQAFVARAMALVHVPSLTFGWLVTTRRGLSEGASVCHVASCRRPALERRPNDTEAKSVIRWELLPGPADGRLARAIPWKPPDRTKSRRRRPGRRTFPGADGREDYAGCAGIPDRTEPRHALARDPRRPGTIRGPPWIRSGARRDPALARAVSIRIEPAVGNGPSALQVGERLEQVDLASTKARSGENLEPCELQHFEDLHRDDEGEDDEERADRHQERVRQNLRPHAARFLCVGTC